MAGRKNSVKGFKIKAAIVCWIVLAITAGIGAYTMPVRYKYPDSESLLQNVSKRSAAVINRYILQSFRHRDNEPGQQQQDFSGQASGADSMENPVSLERRGPKLDRRTYVRCFFNAVSCF